MSPSGPCASEQSLHNALVCPLMPAPSHAHGLFPAHNPQLTLSSADRGTASAHAVPERYESAARCSTCPSTSLARTVHLQVMLELTPRLRMRRADTQLHEASCALQPMSPPSLICADQSTVSTADNRFDHAHIDQSAILEDMLLQQVSALLTVRAHTIIHSAASVHAHTTASRCGVIASRCCKALLTTGARSSKSPAFTCLNSTLRSARQPTVTLSHLTTRQSCSIPGGAGPRVCW